MEYSNNIDGCDSPSTSSASEQKRVTFRKRRLSIPLAQIRTDLLEDDTQQESSDADSKAQTFRKRRLSLTLSKSLEDESNKRARRSSEISSLSNHSNASTVATVASTSAPFRPKTLHAGEIVEEGVPPSPAIRGDHILYSSSSLPALPTLESNAAPLPPLEKPKWSRRETISIEEDHKLPFPRDVVGTYSCHGVEPIYHDDDDDDDDDEAEPDDNRIVVHEQQGDKITTTMAAKINQDRGGVAYPYGNDNRTALFAVYDGHGSGGELVSQFALHEIQRKLEKHPFFRKDTAVAFKQTFLEVDNALADEPIIEPLFAGTTACVALLTNNKLVLANAGDSRAVLARKQMDGRMLALDLTEDQNPDLPSEHARIVGSGGFVSQSPGPGLSARVWLDPACTQIGLAMARSIGDHAVATVGVIAEPVITHHDLEETDEFMILASDGVWEFVSSEDAVQIVGDNLQRGATKACQALIEAAAERWHEEEGEYRDDITAIVVQLKKLWCSEPGATSDATG